MLKGYH